MPLATAACIQMRAAFRLAVLLLLLVRRVVPQNVYWHFTRS